MMSKAENLVAASSPKAVLCCWRDKYDTLRYHFGTVHPDCGGSIFFSLMDDEVWAIFGEEMEAFVRTHVTTEPHHIELSMSPGNKKVVMP